MRKGLEKGLAYLLCAALALPALPGAAYGEEPEGKAGAVRTATASEADRRPEEEETAACENPEEEEEKEAQKEPEGRATASSADRKPAAAKTIAAAPVKAAARSLRAGASSSLGDIWDDWSGRTSFEFLNGDNGEGTEEKPFLIRNREQLMGLSELAAMGMTVREAAGTDYAGDYSGCYFALGANIDLQGVSWIPIGFYRDSSEKAGEVPYAFSGHFDGRGHTIRNLKLTGFPDYDNVGLFGAVKDAWIQDVTVLPDSSLEVKGQNRVGIVAGYAEDSVIRDVAVKNGSVSALGTAGGIAGEVSGTVVENVTGEKVMVNASGGADVIYAGGIAGTASDSAIVDCEVSTGNGNTARIQGTGFIGGITGFQNATDIYNVHVSGAIGGYHSTAIGGITGKYASGKLKVARFEGTIGNSQLGSLAREGTFIGTRQGAATNFNYVEDVACLFADSESKITAGVCGSEISDDNDYTYDAHIGYWHTGDLYYTLLQGGNGKNISDRYFYEELERGILDVLDQEGREEWQLDHFAPDRLGHPVRGYLLTVNQIDTAAGGQSFYDVASLTARGSSQYAKTIDKEHRGAVAAGTVVSVATAPKNTDTEKFQMEGVPFYTNEAGTRKDAAYSEGSHCYAFTMPGEDVSVSAVYKKVAVSITVEPESYTFKVTQTRTGNRKNPSKVTEIKNQEGKLIARYINGELEQGTQVQPVNIKATIDANNDVADGRVKWSIDDPDLIRLAANEDEGTDGYTAQSASLTLNLEGAFFKEIIEEAERKQAEENYQYKIPNTIYGAGHQNGGVAVLTAQTRPAASFEGKPCAANCRINATFQIIDNTLVAAEGAVLDREALTYTVTRRLTGSRTEPKESITVTPPQSLTAAFTPDFFSRDEVAWTSSNPAVVSVSQDSENYREALILAVKDAKWIQDMIETDNVVRANDRYARLSGNGSREAVITVNGKDRLGNHASAQCPVTVNFVTDDQTRIVPEKITLDQEKLTCSLGYRKAGDIQSETVSKSGFGTRKLTASVLPDLSEGESHQPYDQTVLWSSSDPEAVSVDEAGTVTPIDGAPWIQEALRKAPYHGEKEVEITARTKDGERAASCKVFLTFQAECVEADRESESFEIVLTKTGRRTSPELSWSGLEGKKLSASVYGNGQEAEWRSGDSQILTVDQSGMAVPAVLNEKQEITAGWIKEALEKYPQEGSVKTQAYAQATGGSLSDPVTVTLSFRVNDLTTSGGSSGGGGKSSGGGSGGRSVGVTAAGNTQGPAAPKGAVTGTWTQTANGKWIFASGRTYTDEWAYISNPYAAGEQEKASWFRFDKDGFMATGWRTDADGNTYYLKTASDGTQGQMVTGWQLIDGSWYYFNPVSDGTRGKLLTNTVTPDGYRVNEKGQWIS